MCKLLRILLFTLLCIQPAIAKQAGILLLPTRIEFGPADSNATLTLRNNGDATGIYRVELIDMLMPEKGIVEEYKLGGEAPYSAQALLRISPRQIMLKPGQSQNIRILVRKPRNLADGEYRSHVKIRLVESNVEAAKDQGQELAVRVQPRFALVIPVIIRHGNTDYHVTLETPALRYENNRPVLDLAIARQGNRSVLGDVDVSFIDARGKKTLLQHYAGIAVYRPTTKRYVSIPLTLPDHVLLQQGKLHIEYKTQPKEGESVMADAYLAL